MDSIKSKMQSLAQATQEATERANRYEVETRRINDVADKFEDQVRSIQKKMQALEGQYDSCSEQLFEVTMKLEVKEKNLANAEGDVGSLSRRVLLLEEEEERSDERLARVIKRGFTCFPALQEPRFSVTNFNAIKKLCLAWELLDF